MKSIFKVLQIGRKHSRFFLISSFALISFLLIFSSVLLPTTFSWYSGQSAFMVIGQSNFTSSTKATTQNGLLLPYSIAFDGTGNMWVTDSNNNRILEFRAPFSTGESAFLVIGQSNFTSSTKATTQNSLYLPGGVAFDSSGNLWVADTENSRILEFKSPFSIGESASLVIGQPNFTTSAPVTNQSRLHFPFNIAFDTSGNLWVADYGSNRILEFKAPLTTDESASVVIGQSDFTSNSSATTQSGLFSPVDIAFDVSGSIWVADHYNNRILEFKAPFFTGESAFLVIGQSNFVSSTLATTQTGLYQDWGISFDASGNLWVADAANNRILEFGAPFTSDESASIVLGQSNFTSSTSSTGQSALFHATGVAFDASGNLWAVDYGNSRVLEYVNSPITSTVISTSLSTSVTTSTVSVTVPITQIATTTGTVQSGNGGISVSIAGAIAAVTLVVGVVAGYVIRRKI